MSVQSALLFIQKVREDEALQARLRTLDHEAILAKLVDVGRAAGYVFSREDLLAAQKHDWAMRWMHYNHLHTPE